MKGSGWTTWLQILSLGLTVFFALDCSKDNARKEEPLTRPVERPFPVRPIPDQNRMPGEYLATPARGVSPDAFKAAVLASLQAFEPAVVETTAQGMILVRLKTDPGPDAIARAVKKRPEIQAIQPNFIYHAISPSGPGAPQ